MTLTLPAGLDVNVSPSPVAMVWNEPGSPHESVATPGIRLAPGDALVQVEYATVCGSDVHTVRGDRSAPSPLVLGHEQVGRVVALGDGATRADGTALELGDRVVWSVAVSCGSCDRCARGIPQKCRALAKYGHERISRGWELTGGFATHVHVRAGSSIVVVDEALPAEVAAAASCATATAVAAIEAAAETVELDGALLLITGGGMVGLSAAAMAVEAGAEVILSDPDATRRALARRLGAIASDPKAKKGAPEHLDEVLAVRAQRGLIEILVAIEASGAPAAVETVIRRVGVGGAVVLVGSVSPGPAIPVDAESIVRRLLTLKGVHNYTPAQLVRAVEFLERSYRTVPLERLVGTAYPLEELDRALEDAASGRHVRVGVTPPRG
ncbi:alcohol dehydrogenase catalytic domain-containing protein [Agromyces allii]|uniref:alcohol dehydrogenase n=1 Tax=Agromyces allii TaxID=393607 RepID=A0ABN2QTZ3_9MICO|nr:alcohol dehydrogenase catalytic domain-containing protein [Agromyces allii]